MVRRSTPIVSDAAARFIEQRSNRSGSDGVRYAYRSLLARFALSVRDRQVGTLTPVHVEEFFYGPSGLSQTCARSTLGKYRNDMKAFLGWCHRRGWITATPDVMLDGVTDSSTRSRRQRLRLTEPQLWTLVDRANDPRDRALMVFTMHTGVRISEALAARVRDVNLDASTLLLRVIKTKEEDMFNISPAFDAELRAWLTVYTPADREAFLFPAKFAPRRTGRETVTDLGYNAHAKINNPRKIVRGMADRAGVVLEDGDGWHTVRRSVARLFFDKASHMGHDAALRMTSSFLHHKNTATTERYLGLELERAKRDEMMSVGFLSGPADNSNVARLDSYRSATDG